MLLLLQMELKQAVVLRFRCGYLDFCINYSKYDTKRNGLLDYQQAVVVLKAILSFLIFSFRRIPDVLVSLNHSVNT